ncbi:M14 family zinc carboxypeptidase [Nocardioides salsibiostraticola]
MLHTTRRGTPRSATARAGLAAAALSLAVLGTTLAPGSTSVASSSAGNVAEAFAPQLVLVQTPTRADKDRLQTLGLDLTEHAGQDYIEVVAHTASDVATLVDNAFDYTVTIPDLVARDIEIGEINKRYAASVNNKSPLPSGRVAYRTLPEYNSDLAKLQKKNRNIARTFRLPHKSLDGRDVMGVEIGKDIRKPNKGQPTFLLMGVHHAREWPSGELAMEFATDLVNKYGKNKRITDLLSRARVIVVPVVNVDGFNLSRTDGDYIDLRDLNDVDPLDGTTSILATPGRAYMRKNCRIVDGQDTPDNTCQAQLSTPGGFGAGTDLNRNYGGLWGGPGAAGGTPDARVDPTYRGAGPFSEPETQNVQRIVQSRQVTMLISNHTFSNLVLRPNGVSPTTLYSDGLPVGDAPDEEALKDLGARMTANNGYQNIHGWQLYDTTGTTEDWSYNATGGFGYTFEIGPDEFHPPFPDVVNEYRGAGKYAGKGNREAYLVALEHAVDKEFSGSIKGKAPKGAILRLKKSFDTPTWESSFKDYVNTPIKVSGRQQNAKKWTRKGKKYPMRSYSWIMNPSTRPAVQPRSYQVLDTKPFKTQTDEGTLTPATSSVDHEFVLNKTANNLDIELDWNTPDDLDLEVYRRVNDELVQVATSGNSPGEKESAQVVDAPRGTYVLRVVNFASVSPTYTLTTQAFGATIKSTPGKRERYTLTCERKNGKVLQSRKLFIDRGDVKTVNFGKCRRKW